MPKRPTIELPDEQAKESQRIWDIWPPRLGLMTLPGFVSRADGPGYWNRWAVVPKTRRKIIHGVVGVTPLSWALQRRVRVPHGAGTGQPVNNLAEAHCLEMNRPVRTRAPGGVEAASEQSGSLYDLVSQPFLHGPWYSTVVEQNETRFADHEV